MNAKLKSISYPIAAAAIKNNKDILDEWLQSKDPLLNSLASECITVFEQGATA
ncbi:MAG: hypothetical protein ABOK23_12120 [Candidatus Methanoperedens sp.]|nr:hypothetical protein [Candidatus Methanoperedens sp.]MCZ7395292.1 hypothetical protein [Candidatus Methanoperedens sp.]